MNRKSHRVALSAACSITLLLAGCGGTSLNVWPFGGEKVQDRSRPPANATEFQCKNGKRFYVRSIDNGEAAWLILSDREFRLPKSGDSANRYSNGSAVLEINGGEATLTDGSATIYTTCKTPVAAGS